MRRRRRVESQQQNKDNTQPKQFSQSPSSFQHQKVSKLYYLWLVFIIPAIVIAFFQLLYFLLLFEGLILMIKRGTQESRTDYSGFIPNHNLTIDRITNIPSSEDFFDRFIVPRRPVIISPPKSFDEIFGWNTKQWQDVQYLIQKAGDMKLQIEFKNTSLGKPAYPGQNTFGRVGHRTVYFKDYLENVFSNEKYHSSLRCPKHNENQPPKNHYYINLQGGPNKMISPPLSRLTDDFSIPSFYFGDAVHQINFWMGNSIEKDVLNQNQRIDVTNDSYCQPIHPTASVLHSDTADNLYVILEGSKHIKLYNPNDVFNIYTDGCLEKVHPNGRMQWCPPLFLGHTLGISIILREVTAFTGLSKIISWFFSLLGYGEIQRFLKEVVMPPPIWPHFSSIPIDCSEEEIERKFPLFKNTKPLVYTATAGDMVFIPSGWHHQVTSYGTRHVALNFWTGPHLSRDDFDEDDDSDLLIL